MSRCSTSRCRPFSSVFGLHHHLIRTSPPVRTGSGTRSFFTGSGVFPDVEQPRASLCFTDDVIHNSSLSRTVNLAAVSNGDFLPWTDVTNTLAHWAAPSQSQRKEINRAPRQPGKLRAYC